MFTYLSEDFINVMISNIYMIMKYVFLIETDSM